MWPYAATIIRLIFLCYDESLWIINIIFVRAVVTGFRRLQGRAKRRVVKRRRNHSLSAVAISRSISQFQLRIQRLSMFLK